MKNDYKYTIRMAALAMVGAAITACSSIDDDEQAAVPTAGKTVVLTGKLVNKAGDMTRAFTVIDNGTQPKSSWEEGETVAVYYQKSDDSYATATATIKNEEGDFEATLTDPKAGDVQLVYPATRHDGQGGFSAEGIGQQDGTVKNISDNWDIVTGQGTMTVGKDSAKIGEAQMKPQLSICRFVLTDQAEAPLTATQLDIAVIAAGDTTAYSVTRAEASDTFYVAMLPVEGATLTFSTTVGEKAYTKTTTENAVTLAKGTFYPITVMEEKPVIDLSMVDCAGNARTDGAWTANCYMVHTAGDYKLPLVYGNAIKGGEDNTVAYKPGGTTSDFYCANFLNHAGTAIDAPWITKAKTGTGVNKGMGISVKSAELLWQDAQGLITAVGIDGDYLTLTVGKDATTQQGNALVAAKTADGTIVWSWHIWVTKETFADATLTTIATGSRDYKVTPVNLGWVPTGGDGKQGYNTYYQWGRKDPFKAKGAPTDKTVYNIDGAVIMGMTYTNYNSITIADNIQNPTTFYYKQQTNSPCGTQYYNMWDAQQAKKGQEVLKNITTATVKTVYDPCPAGFCVPTSNLFSFMANGVENDIDNHQDRIDTDWDDTNKGKTWKQATYSTNTTGPDLYFPALGYRNTDGTFTAVGTGGSIWSASPDSERCGRSLVVDSGKWFNTWNGRIFGFSVRAVAEPITIGPVGGESVEEGGEF